MGIRGNTSDMEGLVLGDVGEGYEFCGLVVGVVDGHRCIEENAD